MQYITLLALISITVFAVHDAFAINSPGLVFTDNAVQILQTNQSSNMITIRLQDFTKNIIATDKDITVNLSSSSPSGKFSSQSNFSSTIHSLIMPKGAKGASFFYEDPSAGTPQITASAKNIANGTTSFVIIPNAPAIKLPAENAFVNIGKPTISGTAQPGSTITVYNNDTKSGTVIGTAITGNDSSWSITPSLQNGTYSISATSTAHLFTGPFSALRNFTVDTVPPQLSITSPDYNSILNTARSIISGTSYDKSAIKSVTWEIDNGTVKQAFGTTKWSFRTGKLANGPHVIQVNAVNLAGLNTTRWTFFTTDNTPPAVAITQPQNGAILNHMSQINGTASDNTSISQVSIQIDGSSQYTAKYSAGSWSSPAITNLSNGVHTITSLAIDAAGNVNTNKISFTIDSTSPTVSISYPANSTIDTTSPTIAGTMLDSETGVANAYATIDDTYYSLPDTPNWSIGTSDLSQGSHTISVTAIDRAGNTSTVTREFTIDTVPPELYITFPADNSVLDSSTPTINGTAYDDTSISSIKFSIDGGPAGTASGTADWSFVAGKLSDGHHAVQINATDVAGNISTITRTFTVEPTFLRISITSPGNNTKINTDSAQVTGSVASSSTVPYVTWSVDGGPSGTASGTAEWSFSTSTLSSGTHTIQVSAVNTAGVLARQTIIVTEDTHPPMLKITNPIDGDNLNHISAINGTASDDNTISSVTISIDGNDAENATYSSGSWTVPVSLPAGMHMAYAVATDTAGNSVTSQPVHFLLTGQQIPSVPASITSSNSTSVPSNGTEVGNNTQSSGPESQDGNLQDDHKPHLHNANAGLGHQDNQHGFQDGNLHHEHKSATHITDSSQHGGQQRVSHFTQSSNSHEVHQSVTRALASNTHAEHSSISHVSQSSNSHAASHGGQQSHSHSASNHSNSHSDHGSHSH